MSDNGHTHFDAAESGAICHDACAVAEIRRLRTERDALKAQGEKHGIPVGALKRYIAALADDKVEDARNEVDALERLLGDE